MTGLATLRDWLGTLEIAELEAVLERTRTSLGGPRIRDLDELARRLTHPSMASGILLAAPSPLLQVVEAASALGSIATVPALIDLLDDTSTTPEEHAEAVRGWLEEARQSAVLWLDGDVIHVNPGMDRVIKRPLGLARPLRMELPESTTDDLRRLLRAWKIAVPARKAEMVSAAETSLSDAARFRRIAGNAPAEIFDTLHAHVRRQLSRMHTATEELLGQGSYLDAFDIKQFDRNVHLAEQKMWEWAAFAGLALSAKEWSLGIGNEFPSEVYLALAPADFHIPFAPEAPPVATVPVPPEQLMRSSAAAAADFLGAAMAILEVVLRDGIAMLKSGGVGSRELSRLAKQVGTDVPTVRLALGLAAELGLLQMSRSGRVRTADEFDTWRRKPSASRTADLVLSWLPQNAALTAEHDRDGKPVSMFTGSATRTGLPMPRILCRVLAEFPGEGAIDQGDVIARAAWKHPACDFPTEAGANVWSEGHRLGVIADGALAPFARVLLTGDTAEATGQLTDVLPESTGQAIFGSDLTVLVPGSPDADVVDLLDIVAVREGHGVANSWRVSTTSVRNALDTGYAAEELIGALRKIADKPLPQALEYLIRDVDRKHGHLGVRAAGTALTADDESLITELLATKSLHSLGLSRIAPTAAIAQRPPREVIPALRTAGYMPVQVDGDGEPLVQLKRVPGGTQSVIEPDAGEPGASESAPDDASSGIRDELSDASLAAFLESAGEPAGEPDDPERVANESFADAAHRLVLGPASAQVHSDELEGRLAESARHLTPSEISELAEAIETGGAVWMRYQSPARGVRLWVVSDMKVLGARLYAYSRSTQEELLFRLEGIVRISPD